MECVDLVRPRFVSQVSHQKNEILKNISSAISFQQISGKKAESKIKLP